MTSSPDPAVTVERLTVLAPTRSRCPGDPAVPIVGLTFVLRERYVAASRLTVLVRPPC
jgi:hypothetical protein